MTSEPESPRVLIVDDDAQLLRLHERALVKAGYRVETAQDGKAAMRALGSGSFDVVLSDIDMPEMDGIRLLEQVRVHDLDVPVVLITGTPSMETAIRALEQGALRYLQKPIELAALVKIVADAVRLHRIAKAKRRALELIGDPERFIGDHAGLVASFGRALDSLYIAYQPIVSWSKKKVIAYEALLRTREISLPHPGAVLDAATRLGRLYDLGRKIRTSSVAPCAKLPSDVKLFVNLHPSDLLDDQLYAGDGPFAAFAERIVLEITERASLAQTPDLLGRLTRLRLLGFQIAVDDLGAGYAGLTSFALLEPDIVKLDMALVRDVHRAPTKQTLIKTMITMCNELGIMVTAEGIEVPEERLELARSGCDLMQGYLFAKPGEPFPEPQY